MKETVLSIEQHISALEFSVEMAKKKMTWKSTDWMEKKRYAEQIEWWEAKIEDLKKRL